jgi:hypothetical protein
MGRKAIVFGLMSVLSLHGVLPASAAERRLPDGTRIPVRVMEQLSSGSLRDNDPVNFAVVEDVIVDGEVIVKQGTPVRGVVVEAEAKRRMGRAGKLSYTVNETKAIDRSVIRLRAVQEKRGNSNVTSTAVTTTAVAVFVPVAAPFFLLRKGSDIVVPEGTRVDAFVDGDHSIRTGADGTAVVAPGTAGEGDQRRHHGAAPGRPRRGTDPREDCRVASRLRRGRHRPGDAEEGGPVRPRDRGDGGREVGLHPAFAE